MNNFHRTPYYVISKEDLDRGLSDLRNALDEAWANNAIGYSYKTNALPYIISYFNDSNCYAEVVSDDEYELAKSIGAKHIIYNGIAKTKETFTEAIINHNIVNIDASYEIDWLDNPDIKGCEVGIRVNFDLEAMCPGQTQCGEDGERFGFCYENGELKKAIELIQSKGCRIAGLHLHKSSKTRMPDIYLAIARTAVEIVQKYSLELSYVDIGGGFFGGLDWKPQFPDYFNQVASVLCEAFNPEKTKLIVEPGMALIGPAVDYVTTVTDVKRTNRNTFVVTNGSRTQIDPLMTKNSYFYDIERADNRAREILDRQIISGYTCMEHDRLFEVKSEPELKPGDAIVYHKVGAYTMSLSPLFIKWFPDVYLKDGNKMHLVRNRWGANEYRNNSIGEEK